MIKIIKDIEQEMDKIFLTYEKILYRFKVLNITTKHGKEISHLDLRKAVDMMIRNIFIVDGEVRKLEVKN